MEGFSRNAFNLLQVIHDEKPSIIFAAEPWLHLPDAPVALKEYTNQYSYYLNSEDRHDTLLSLEKSRAHGGTLALWSHNLDPYITVLEPPSSHVLPILLEKPGYQASVHITVYLPTAGKDAEFMRELSNLQDVIDNVIEKHPDSEIFLRGDANASIPTRAGNKRDAVFEYFLDDNKLLPVSIGHKSYHHFVNNGLSDSNIDIIAHTGVTNSESLLKVLCSKVNAFVDSSHDILITSVTLPNSSKADQSPDNVKAPVIEHTKHKVKWSDEGILAYQELLSSCLPTLQSDYCDVSDTEVASVLFRVSTHMLTEAAKNTNDFVELGNAPKAKKPHIPKEVKVAARAKVKALKALNAAKEVSDTLAIEAATANFKLAKSEHQNLVRKYNVMKEIERDTKLLSLLSKEPKEIFKSVKNTKTSQSRKLKSLQVDDKVYAEDSIADGFFDSISQLKTSSDITATSFNRFADDHRHIVEICKSGAKIPEIGETEAKKLLGKIRPGVSDFYSITAAHFLNGGDVTIKLFQFLINTVLKNIEIASVEEMNKAHAIILHKGHHKSRSLASSYRTISSCPFLAKATEIYLGDLTKEDWASAQAPTQFQGPGMSHELASLLLTISIQNSMNSSKPLFVLLLDAKSAFDLVVREILVRRLFLDTTPDQRIRYWDLRLSNRVTFCLWDGKTMGPIHDQLGVEQGGPNSTELYKSYNNEQLVTAQDSVLGTLVSGCQVASVGQADDTALLSNDIHQLQHLLDLSLIYCKKHQVQLSTGKTKLLLFTKSETDYTKYVKLLSPLHIGDTSIPFSDTAEHVGVLRSVTSNLPHILQRIVSHKRALAQILCMGMSRRHRANPLASLRAESIFASPVLFSGMASLSLSKSETDTISHHVKVTTEKLLKLHPKTPEPVVFFLAGRLPGEALLHLKQLTLFGMICRLPGNILHNIAMQLLMIAKQSDRNWFAEIRNLCYKYNLPHPLLMLKEPLTKHAFKSLIKTNITDYWQSKLRAHCTELKSLKYFKPQYMSLRKPHPMLQYAQTSFTINKCITVCRMLSGRFRCGSLLRHFSKQATGLCELCCTEIEDLTHILVPRCVHLQDQAELLLKYAHEKLRSCALANEIFFEIMKSKDDSEKVQMLLDPTVLPEVISANQANNAVIPTILCVTVTWCYSMNRRRIKLMGN